MGTHPNARVWESVSWLGCPSAKGVLLTQGTNVTRERSLGVTFV